MGRLTPRWETDQRQAIVRAILDGHDGRKRTAREAITLAREGRLGLPPFDMPIKTARYYANRARDNRRLESLPASARHSTARFLRDATERLVKVADRLSRELVRRGPNASPRQGIEIAKLLQELQKLDSATTNGDPRTPTGRQPPTEAPTNGFVAGLANQLDPPSKNDPHTGDVDGDSDAGTATPPTAPTQASKPNDGGVSAHVSASARRAALGRVGQQLG